ncbi:MAG TPA: hypothetical protein VGS08_06025 [Candidatus Saccharimonadales bacterium]|nr:hypothetical protein [Candidatus Saccharimonadales bacterium]
MKKMGRFISILGPTLVIMSGSASAHSSARPPILHQIAVKTAQSWPWYIARGAGLTAAVLLILLIFSGIGLVTGFTYRLLEPVAAWAVHKAIALAFGASVCIHVFALLFDHYVGFSLWQLLIPFLSHYKPVTIGGMYVGSLYVALGVYAFYIAAIVILSSIYWKEKRPYLWQGLHYLGYLLVILTFFHALYLGADLQHGWLRWLWITLGVALFIGIVMRLRRFGTLGRRQK